MKQSEMDRIIEEWLSSYKQKDFITIFKPCIECNRNILNHIEKDDLYKLIKLVEKHKQ